ncbi:RNA ligase family protein [Cohnella zeiphila]|uniref:DNA ligase (ATP) n=1 Tax=Cohnella zeiphila TaxID=2761120 RepID=A0A7X0VVN0_9BACL|nr:RNA ligase family protein [Cohnella zeiphila]MBB6730043.1 DNA ligase [Cohnella zeiphila]
MNPIIPFEPIRSDTVPLGDSWIYQIKWDGVRILSYCDDSAIRLYNRKKHERTAQYPELTERTYCRASSFILDGEVIALAADGKPSFHEVMRRDGIRNLSKVPQARQEVPISYMVFDVLYADGAWTHSLPLRERQRLLADLLVPGPFVQPVASHPDGPALLEVIRAQKMEGIVAKNADSAYAFGGKDERWVKVKNYGDLVAVIGGYTLNGGIVNAVLAGLYQGGRLIFIGKVGTGKLTAQDWVELTAVVGSIGTSECPFASRHPDMKGAYWVKPLLTAKIQYAEWRVEEGRSLRQPSIQAFVQVPPEECRFE